MAFDPTASTPPPPIRYLPDHPGTSKTPEMDVSERADLSHGGTIAHTRVVVEIGEQTHSIFFHFFQNGKNGRPGPDPAGPHRSTMATSDPSILFFGVDGCFLALKYSVKSVWFA